MKYVVDKYTKLLKPSNKLPSKITALVRLTTFESYGSFCSE